MKRRRGGEKDEEEEGEGEGRVEGGGWRGGGGSHHPFRSHESATPTRPSYALIACIEFRQECW